MSFLDALKNQKNKLKETTTVVTKMDGQRYSEKDSNITSLHPNAYGFIVDTKPDNIPAKILEYLYIGSQDCAVNSVIESYDIKHVLSLGIRVDISVDNKFINCLDLPESNAREILKDALPYVRKAIDDKKNVLVHCNAGVSRTSLVAIGYLMHYEKISFDEAYGFVKSLRPAVQPNDGFRKQLKSMKPGEII